MGLITRDDGRRMSDPLGERMEPLLPPRKSPPRGCHNPRVPDRQAMNAILFVLRTGCHWNALKASGLGSSSSAPRRFREWTAAGGFLAFWRADVFAYDGLQGVDGSWLALAGAMRQAPIAGSEKNRRQSDGARPARRQAKGVTRCGRETPRSSD